MKKFLPLAKIDKLEKVVCLFSFIVLLLTSCKREFAESLPIPNEKPVAIAGPDQVISVDSILLSGGNSYTNAGKINAYLWTKIYGPDTFNIKHPTEAKTIVNKLVPGVYGFELKVTDNNGLFSRDTVQVTVIFPPLYYCNNTNRSQVNVQLIPAGPLTQLRAGMAVVNSGNKLFFAGGSTGSGPSSRVDIYDIATLAWTTAELSQARYGIAAIALGNKIFFAGGVDAFYSYSKVIDIYNISTNTWSIDSLSEPRSQVSVGAIGNSVFFAGGNNFVFGYEGEYSSTVDIYNLSTNSWATANFNTGRAYMSIAAAGNKLYFAGGVETYHDDALDRVDIYDNTTNSWLLSRLNEPKVGLSAIALANKIYWAGGSNSRGGSCSVEIKDVNTGISTNAYLYKASDSLYYYGADKAVARDSKIIFLPRYSDNKFDIYDTGTNSWSIGVLPVNIIRGGSIFSVNNTIYIVGAFVNGVLSSQLWKLEF